MEDAATTSDMRCEEKPDKLIFKTRELLSDAQQLLRNIEELLDCCTLTGPSNVRRRRRVQLPYATSLEEDGEALIIDGLRFESAVSREELRKLSSKAGAGGRQGDT